MTREEAINQLKIELSMWESECKSHHATKEALKVAIEALEKEPCEDCVSRKAVINIIDELSGYIHNYNAYRLIRGINALPSMQPSRLKAKWLDNIDSDGGKVISPFWNRYICSNCGRHSDLENYCCNCGAYMEDEE